MKIDAMVIKTQIVFARNTAWYAKMITVKGNAQTGGSVDFMNIVFKEFVNTINAQEVNIA